MRRWDKVLEECAAAWNRPLEKGFFQFRHSLTVPPDDLIHIEFSSRLWNEHRSERRLLLSARWPGHWQDKVLVEARRNPRVLYTFRQTPKAIDDPARPWIVRSKNPMLAGALVSPDLVRMIDEVWDPQSWMAVWERKGEVRVVVGELDTGSSIERLYQLIAIMRILIAGARTLSPDQLQPPILRSPGFG